MAAGAFNRAVAVTWAPDDPVPRLPQETVDRLYSCVRVVDMLLGELGIPYFVLSGTCWARSITAA